MLVLRPNCERCDCDLAPHGDEAFICSFECTFCRSCAEDILGGICPNCGGKLLLRPSRSGSMLEKYPASSERVLKQG